MSAQAPARANTSDLLGWRMRALGLGDSVDSTPGAVVERLLALQGQDWNSSRWAIGVRAPGITDADVIAAFNSGELVRSWPMRGTIHIVAAADIAWMQSATNARVLAGAQKRRAFLGLDEATLSRMTEIAVEGLTGGRSLSRDELADAWLSAGITGPSNTNGIGPWRYHVVWWLCQNGITVPGPVGDGASEPRLVLADEWIQHPRAFAGDAALAELAHRFARGRGPVQEKDLAWWTGLGLRDVRRGIAAAAADSRLTSIEIDGLIYWAEPELLDSPAEIEDRARLLPAFDEHLLGYTDRSAVLRAEHFDRIVPGRNGVFRSTVIEGGRTVGTWKRTSRSRATRLDVEALPGEVISLERLRMPASEWGSFAGANAELQLI